MVARSIAGRQVLLEDGTIGSAQIWLRDGEIDALSAPDGAAEFRFDEPDQYILPGIVDLHGDAFERQIMPRPGVMLPINMAVVDTDSQLVANGITTAFHGVTFSWEQGLRGRDTAASLLDALDAEPLRADHRIHLRFETYNFDGTDQAIAWIEQGRIHLLCFNDHFDGIHRAVNNDSRKLGPYTGRSGQSREDYLAQINSLADRAHELPATLERLSAAAAALGVPIAAHDEMSWDDRARNAALGCIISDFPIREEAATAARSTDIPVIMGAPNVVRGGSHMPTGICAAEMVGRGVCTILASDYYYPALLLAPFRLVADEVTTLPEAWHLVSRNPARAVGLTDRGEIAAGRRADFIVVNAADRTAPRIEAVFAGGRPVHLAQTSPQPQASLPAQAVA